jgi:hypothetical protein
MSCAHFSAVEKENVNSLGNIWVSEGAKVLKNLLKQATSYTLQIGKLLNTSALYEEKYAAIGDRTEFKNRLILLSFLSVVVQAERKLAELERTGGSAHDISVLKVKLEFNELNADAHAEAMRKRYVLGDVGDGAEYYGDGDQSDTVSHDGMKLSFRAGMNVI